jgi:hypothetical protein
MRGTETKRGMKEESRKGDGNGKGYIREGRMGGGGIPKVKQF